MMTPSAWAQEQALEYHKTVEGEYGCPGLSCPGVQRLAVLLEKALAAVRADEGAPDDWREFVRAAFTEGWAAKASGEFIDSKNAYAESHVKLQLESMPLPASPRED